MKIALVLSDTAVADILEQGDWYQGRSGGKLAQRWESAVTNTLLRILKNPLSGASCNFKSNELAEVRRMSIPGFPKHLIFYRFQDEQLQVLRIVHGARDLESLF